MQPLWQLPGDPVVGAHLTRGFDEQLHHAARVRQTHVLGGDAALRMAVVVVAERDTHGGDLVAELLTEQGDLEGALDWATAGVDACLAGEDRDELQLLLRLRYRLRVDLGLPEDDYDKLLDVNKKAGPAAGR